MQPLRVSSSSIGHSTRSLLPSIIFMIIFSSVGSTLIAAFVVEVSHDSVTQRNNDTNRSDLPVNFPETSTRSMATASSDLKEKLQQEARVTSEAEDMMNSKVNKTLATVDQEGKNSSSEESTITQPTITILPQANNDSNLSGETNVTSSSSVATTIINETSTIPITTITTATTTTTTTTTISTTPIITTTAVPTTTTTTTTMIPPTTITIPITTIPPASTTIATTTMTQITETPKTESSSSSSSESVTVTELTEENEKMPSGIIVLVTMITFAIVAVIGYVSLIVWRRYLEYRYGNRELLVNDLEFDTNDLRHFEL